MPLRLESGIMKVGNSLVLVIPKALQDTFEFEKGESVPIIVGDEGIFIPLKSKLRPSDFPEDLKALRKYK